MTLPVDRLSRVYRGYGLATIASGGSPGSSSRLWSASNSRSGPDRADIALVSGDETHVDERDMLTPEEIERIRNAADHPRDLAILDLLLYTGQRNTAIRSLRIRDVDPETMVSRNTINYTLKGNGTGEGLIGSCATLYRPAGTDWKSRMLSHQYFGAVPKIITHDPMKQKAGIDKPMSAHKLRHNFVTIAKREHNLDDATIKRLIGHSPDSQVMETTYAHLSDEDYIQNAEVAFGLRDPDEKGEGSLSPEVCSCGEPLPPEAKACPRCGTVYAPDAKAVEYAAEDAKEDAADRGMDSMDSEEIDALKAIRDAVDDPTVLAEKLSALED